MMRNFKRSVVGLVLSVGVTTSANAYLSLEQRIARLEQQLDAKQSMVLLRRIDALQQRVQELQGKLETTDHALGRVRQQQQVLYRDIDRRLVRLNTSAEAKRVASSQPASDTSPVALKKSDEYKLAYQLLLKKAYPESERAFSTFIRRYPRDLLTANAHYWLGEIHLIRARNDAAIINFKAVIEQYPEHPKAADALLKLGYAYHAGGQLGEARKTLIQVKQQYPRSSLARLADGYLKKMP